MNRIVTTVIALAATAPFVASAKEEAAEASTFDEIWGLATLYKDNSNPILQEFKLRGRYHGQYYKVDADQGAADDWEDRRSRFGFDAKLFDKKIELRADFQSNNGFEDIYDGLVDAYIRWKPVKTFSLTVGKTKPLIGRYDWLESTNTQPTFERSQIFNQLGINRATAITAEGSISDFTWQAGIYSNSTPSTTGGTGRWGDGEFGDLDGGVSTTLGVGYNLKGLIPTDKADIAIDWLHSDREAGDVVLARYDDIVSSTFTLKEKDAGLVVEGFYATGGDGVNSDVFGFYIQPTYDLIPKTLQLVGRYSFSHSSEERGVVVQSRYEGQPEVAPGARGDTYHALYAGLQYFIYGDKLKLLAGAEYAKLDGESGDAYKGVTYLTGIRFSF